MRIRSALFGAAGLGIIAAAALPALAERTAPPMILPAMYWQGPSDGPEAEARDVIQDANTFAKSWAAKVLPADEARKIDFAKHTVLAIATGTRATGGYSITIAGMYDVPAYGPRGGRAGTPAEITVRVVESKPKADAAVTQAQTHPWQIVVIPKTAKPVKFTTSVQ